MVKNDTKADQKKYFNTNTGKYHNIPLYYKNKVTKDFTVINNILKRDIQKKYKSGGFK